MSKELKRSLHKVNAALIKCLNASDTWHQIEQAAQAALHCHLRYELMQKAEMRSMQENSTTSASVVDKRKSQDIHETRPEVARLIGEK